MSVIQLVSFQNSFYDKMINNEEKWEVIDILIKSESNKMFMLSNAFNFTHSLL